jgi:cytochrome c-type biogenesis protein CcmH/NrfF
MLNTFAVVLSLLVSLGAHAQTAERAAQQQIRASISATYDKAGSKVRTDPIAVDGDFAVADWVQGDNGGRALLQKSKGKWEITSCGGDSFKDANTLVSAGIPRATAERLVHQLGQAEKALSAEQVKRFGLFGTANDPRVKEAQAHHQH